MMTDLRARLADALLEHMVCECGEWAENIEEHCRHLADALLSLPGIAIVELPTQCIVPTGWDDSCLGAWLGPSGEDPVSAWPRTGSESVAMPDGGFIGISDARALAAALLAAANAAEQAVHTDG